MARKKSSTRSRSSKTAKKKTAKKATTKKKTAKKATSRSSSTSATKKKSAKKPSANTPAPEPDKSEPPTPEPEPPAPEPEPPAPDPPAPAPKPPTVPKPKHFEALHDFVERTPLRPAPKTKPTDRVSLMLDGIENTLTGLDSFTGLVGNAFRRTEYARFRKFLKTHRDQLNVLRERRNKKR